MKLKNVFSAIFAAIGLVAFWAAIVLSFTSLNAGPVMLKPPQEARAQATALMDAVCRGDYEQASSCILGNPGLGMDREAADEVGGLFWEAFEESRTYELVGDCAASDVGLTQKVRLTCLDVRSVTENLQERSRKLLEQRIEEAEDVTEIYDEDNDYKEEFVMDVLYEAAEEALKQDREDMTVELTLSLVYQNGQWWVAADDALLGAISGGILY